MKLITVILSLLACLNTYAQVETPDTINSDSVQYNATAFRLFSPLKYDRTVTNSFFSLHNDTTLMDRVLMRTYLQHPEVVELMPKHEDDESGIVLLAPQKQTRLVDKVKVLMPEVKSDKEKDIPLDIDSVKIVVTKPHFWKFSGDYSLQFMQNYVSQNWYSSGNSSYSMLGVVTLQLNYNNKQRFKWENKLEMRLGFLTTNADSVNNFKTSDDLIRYTTQISLQAYKKWYYAFQTIASTQFTKGRKDNDTKIYSDFLSPLNLNLSLGMNYAIETKNKKLTGNILIAPLSYKLTYSDRLELSTSFGIDEGKHSLHNIGSLINASVVWQPLDKFKWESRLYMYTTYKMFQLECENTLSFQFNRFLATKLYLYPRFDSSVEKTGSTYWQFKENLSVGFAYTM